MIPKGGESEYMCVPKTYYACVDNLNYKIHSAIVVMCLGTRYVVIVKLNQKVCSGSGYATTAVAVVAYPRFANRV